MKMYTISLTLTAFMISTSAVYSADLYKVNIQSVPEITTYTTSYNSYLGVFGGTNSFDKKYNKHFGIYGGYSWNKYFGSEVVYMKQLKHNHSNKTDSLFGNALIKYSFDSFTPYVAVGPGYRWSQVGREEVVYNVGPGLKYSINDRIDWDTRYSYVRGVETQRKFDQHLFSTGLTFKF